LFSRYASIDAAVTGQTNMTALTGRPGNSCSPVNAPSNQNGRERANSNRKNVDTDVLSGATALKASSDR
jgi:hypothetical protein